MNTRGMGVNGVGCACVNGSEWAFAMGYAPVKGVCTC